MLLLLACCCWLLLLLAAAAGCCFRLLLVVFWSGRRDGRGPFVLVTQGGTSGSRNPFHAKLASRWAPRPERRGGRAPEATGSTHGAGGMWFRVLTHPAVQCWHRQLPEAPPQFASTVVGVVCQRSGTPRLLQ